MSEAVSISRRGIACDRPPGSAPIAQPKDDMLIEDLKAIQERCGHLPEDELRALSARTRVPLYEIQGVASFYPHFHLAPPPPVRVDICVDLACHLRDAGSLKEDVEAAIPGGDREKVRVCGVSCLGRCDRPCAIAVNDHIYDDIPAGEVSGLIRSALAGEGLGGKSPTVPGGPWKIDPYRETPKYEALRGVLSEGPESVIERLKTAGLRGMGGAGFPAGLKWEIVRKAEGVPKYVVCNADESEPGTFKDRVILETLPHLVIEGMVLGGLAIGAERGILYLRHEYGHVVPGLERELDEARNLGLLGPDIPGSGRAFEIEIFLSPGGYICGEETALLEALEGKRAEPRNKPPFPGHVGLWGKPTLINNVETFAHAPSICLNGPDWFIAQGEGDAAGLKFLALSGDVNRPGVYEVPLGTPVRRLIEENGGGVSGGNRLKAFMPGGTSSGFLPASMADIPLDFKPLTDAGSMLGSGAVVAIAEGRDMLDLAFNAMRFFRNESCGKCVPCRMGTEKIVDLLRDALTGRGRPEAAALIRELSDAMMETSICGLGQAAPNPILSVIRHFPDEAASRIEGRS